MSKLTRDYYKPRWPKRLFVFFIISVALIFTTVILARYYYHQNLQAVSASQHNQLINIPTGSSVHEIAVKLQAAGLIRSTWAFEWYIRNHGLRDQLEAGSYNLRPNQTVRDIVNVLFQGQVAVDLFTILPAQRMDQIRNALLKAGYSDADINNALNPDRYQDHPALVDKTRGASLEGYLYPESFQKITSTKPETIIRASLDQMQKHLTPELRAGIVRQGLTVHEGVILASIIEQEVGKPSDRSIVAQVFLKRLREGTPLGSDVTAIYGAILANKSPSLIYDSLYNTHIHTGLPPGPISNVSMTSLAAVAQPASSDYLFFVAGDDGTTYFSRTLEEHQALTKQHCQKLCSAAQ